MSTVWVVTFRRGSQATVVGAYSAYDKAGAVVNGHREAWYANPDWAWDSESTVEWMVTPAELDQ